MPDFSNAKIYKITCNETEKIYIGSTTSTLTKRFKRHKSNYKSWKNGKYNYTTSFKMFDEYGKESCNITLIENYPCDNNKELELREAYYIRNNNCYNKYIPGRTIKEYYEENKEKINEQHKQYNEVNKKRIKEVMKKYYEDNKEKIKAKITCDCGGKYTHNNKTTHFKTKKHQTYDKQQQQIININITNLTINN